MVPGTRFASLVPAPESECRRGSHADGEVRALRVAALADVHGNAPALEAVLAEVRGAAVDAVVFCGDLTWGPLPNETLALVRALELPVHFVRGNADRMVGVHGGDRGDWIAARHDEKATRLVHGFASHVVLDVDGLGPTRFVHGSPRSDEECVTPRTPAERVREFMAGVPERVVVTAHVHVSYDRVVDGIRLVGPGSVGRPYEGARGARWALLGPDVELRRTDYDHEATAELYRASGIPGLDDDLQMLLDPLPRDEAIAYAEERVFAG